MVTHPLLLNIVVNELFVLASLLLNVVVNELLVTLEGTECKVIAYAYAVAVTVSSKFVSTISHLLTMKYKIPNFYLRIMLDTKVSYELS